jgi:hypothetical protein
MECALSNGENGRFSFTCCDYVIALFVQNIGDCLAFAKVGWENGRFSLAFIIINVTL